MNPTEEDECDFFSLVEKMLGRMESLGRPREASWLLYDLNSCRNYDEMLDVLELYRVRIGK